MARSIGLISSRRTVCDRIAPGGGTEPRTGGRSEAGALDGPAGEASGGSGAGEAEGTGEARGEDGIEGAVVVEGARGVRVAEVGCAQLDETGRSDRSYRAGGRDQVGGDHPGRLPAF